jgi:predicted DCC family thiol-disulfide oxidoreductase YuxK
MTESSPVIFYDGVCGLCDRSIQFIIRHDRREIFRFAALQSDYAGRVLGKAREMETFALYDNGRVFERSDGALRIFSKLGFPWALLAVFRIIPKFLRDAVYNLVARNRYRWFGQFDSCPIPTPEQKARFIS